MQLGNRTYAAVYDASEARDGKTSDEILAAALEGGAEHTALIAINDGRLLNFFSQYSDVYPECYVAVDRYSRDLPDREPTDRDRRPQAALRCSDRLRRWSCGRRFSTRSSLTSSGPPARPAQLVVSARYSPTGTCYGGRARSRFSNSFRSRTCAASAAPRSATSGRPWPGPSRATVAARPFTTRSRTGGICGWRTTPSRSISPSRVTTRTTSLPSGRR